MRLIARASFPWCLIRSVVIWDFAVDPVYCTRIALCARVVFYGPLQIMKILLCFVSVKFTLLFSGFCPVKGRLSSFNAFVVDRLFTWTTISLSTFYDHYGVGVICHTVQQLSSACQKTSQLTGFYLRTKGRPYFLFRCTVLRIGKYKNSPCNQTCDLTVLIGIGIGLSSHSTCWQVNHQRLKTV